MSPVVTLERSVVDRPTNPPRPRDDFEPMLVRPLHRELPPVRRRTESPRTPAPAPAWSELMPTRESGNSTDALDLDPVLVTPLRRPEVKKKKVRRTPAGLGVKPGVLRSAALIVGGAFGIAFAGHFAAAAVAPVVQTQRTGQEIQVLQQELKRAQAHNDQLRKEIALMDTRTGIEHEARRRGYVKADEVAVGLVFPEAAEVRPDAPTSRRGSKSMAERIRDAVDSTLAVFGGQPGGSR